ncbi:chemotaxis protein CheW [Bacillus salipaludis]|uniref:chemotaxis protein CheW n=1 Tax=Bacillus salipaludis TaxID=2547811 RepID=UPI003D19C7FA
MEIQDLKILIFKVGQEEFGVQISQVISIERMQTITPYPNRPPHVLGVTTIRDVVTPVVDLRSALIGEVLSPTDEARLIVVQVYDKAIGLVVDAATDVMDIAHETIQHPTLMESKNVSYLKGVSMLDDRLVILLDIEKLLDDTSNLDELKELKNTTYMIDKVAETSNN